MCLHMNLGIGRGLRRWRGSILAPQRNPDLLGSYCLPKHQVISVRSEQNPSKLQHCLRCLCKSFGFQRAHCATSLNVVRQQRVKHTGTVSVFKETQSHLYVGHILKDYEMIHNLYASKQSASPWGCCNLLNVILKTLSTINNFFNPSINIHECLEPTACYKQWVADT